MKVFLNIEVYLKWFQYITSFFFFNASLQISEKLVLAVKEVHASLDNKDSLQDPPSTPWYLTAVMLKAFDGGSWVGRSPSCRKAPRTADRSTQINIFESYWIKPKSDCIYHFLIDLEANGHCPFGSESIGAW